jgi:hypothetical protein
MHRWGWGYMRNCAQLAKHDGDDGKRYCSWHIKEHKAKKAYKAQPEVQE